MKGTIKPTSFLLKGEHVPVTFIETMKVKEGVSCDVYQFQDDDSKDLAVVTVQKGHKTPLQRVLSGTKTAEGHIVGEGVLTIDGGTERAQSHAFPASVGHEVTVQIGQTMQWEANGETDLVFYEVCDPPYQDGRFENLPE